MTARDAHRARYDAEQLLELGTYIANLGRVTYLQVGRALGWDRERTRFAVSIVAYCVDRARLTNVREYSCYADWRDRITAHVLDHPPLVRSRGSAKAATGAVDAPMYPSGDAHLFDTDHLGRITYIGPESAEGTVTAPPRPTVGIADGFLLNLRELVGRRARVTDVAEPVRTRITHLLQDLTPMAEGTPRASYALRVLRDAWESDSLWMATAANVDEVRKFVLTLGVR
jgi:hypothetical protein